MSIPSTAPLESTAASLTNPLSDAGFRSVLPALVPVHLRSRANAADSNVAAIGSLLGPPLGGLAVQLLGPVWGLIPGGAQLILGAMPLTTIRDPPRTALASNGLWRDAMGGLAYVWRNHTLRGVSLTYAPVSLVFGVLAIVVPVLVLRRFEMGPAVVGALFGIQGGAGMLGTMAGGRLTTHGRESVLMTIPGIAIGLALVAVVLVPSLPIVAIAMITIGLMQSMMVVALFTLRQRGTDPAWWGRAFAISTAVNRLGNPLGAGLAGRIVANSLEGALLLAAAAALASAMLAWSTLRPHRRSERR